MLTAGAGQGVYSVTTDTIVMIVGWPPANASTAADGSGAAAAAAAATAVAAAPGQEPQGPRLSCTYYLEKYCKADVWERRNVPGLSSRVGPRSYQARALHSGRGVELLQGRASAAGAGASAAGRRLGA
eukprot:SAG31_NODE_5856_length_2291_cov_10.778285_3_plen_128_part_00